MKDTASHSPRIQLQGKESARVGDVLIEVEAGVDSQRALTGALLKLAYQLSERAELRGCLLLVNSAITLPRLREEWDRVAQVLRPEILQRLSLCLSQKDRIQGVPNDPDEAMQSLLREKASEEQAFHACMDSLMSAKPAYDILRILINQWIRRAGPLTSRWIGQAAGCSYPTVASALEKLDKYLIRHSDRRVELKAFPKDEWFRLVMDADKVRHTLRFADHSGQPRSVESLLGRLQKLRPEGVAIAGVLGARHWHPSIDLIGTPRLDLTLYHPVRQPELGFLRQLDPALKPARQGEPARLVIHAVRYPYRFSETDGEGVLWADPVECLLDLHEMRLESQALEFLQALAPKGDTP
jgi:hypothetical protein